MEVINISEKIILQGRYNVAKVFTYNIDEACTSQIIDFLNQEFVEGEKVRIMPDCHAGKGSVIGTTMTVTNKVVPNLVGVDIGCGVTALKINVDKITNEDLVKLDNVIRKHIPSGREVRDKESTLNNIVGYSKIRAPYNYSRAKSALGTLGGGNHFIELNYSEKNKEYYLVVHTGSRSLGKDIATYYQKQAEKYHSNKRNEIDLLISELKKQGREKEIEKTIQNFKYQNKTKAKKDLAYLEGELMENYLNDLYIAQDYAELNRLLILGDICNAMGWSALDTIQSVHNYIDPEDKVLRKGAIKADKGQKVIIPLNMRDGSIIAVGKGCEDWNNSAPHGAGRLMSRTKAKENLSLDYFKETMKDIFSTTVNTNTLDEAPDAYKPMEHIINNITETIEIIDIVRPVYNFKACE